MKYKSIVFVTPEPIKNMGNFREYLRENTEDLITFHFPHGYSDKKSYMEKFHKEEKILRIEFPILKIKSNIIRLILYWIYLQYIIFRYTKRGTFVIVEKPFFLVFGRIVSLLKRTNFVYWIGDYYPDNKGFMKAYNFLADYYNKNLKYVIYESPPVEKAYMAKVQKKDIKGKHRSLITLGMKNEKIIRKKPKGKIVLGFIGVIREMQGLDLVFDYLSKKKDKNIVLEIIGSGYKLDYYKKLSKKMKLKNVIFHGFVEDLRATVKRWNIGLALYENREDNVSIYCEPTKIKDYLEFGLPVITTKATYFYKELKESKAGEVIEENIDSLDKSIERIENGYAVNLLGIEKILKKYDYTNWYDEKFSFLTKKP